MPLPGRFLTSVLVRREGELLLFDCGEGTQVSLKKLNLKWKKISRIFISHMHADHVTGLPGMLMLSSQVDRTEPLHIYGPAKLKEYIDSSRSILDMYINYEIIVHTVTDEGVLVDEEDFTIESFRLYHTKQCFGYKLTEKPRAGKFFPQKAIELGVPVGPLWSDLQRGLNVSLPDGSVVEASQVVGPKRKGRKFTFITDTAYRDQIAEHAADSDLLICEGMFDSSLEESAKEKRHLTSVQAAQIALKAGNVKTMGLIHYSPRYNERELRELLKEARELFSDTFLCRDQQYIELHYEDQ